MDKILELLKLFEKFGVKPGKIIGAGDRKVVPIKKPILSKPLNRSYILEDVEGGKIGINTVKNEIEDIAPLLFQKQLNDVEINNAISNLNYLDKLLNPTNIVDIKTKQPVKGLESLRPSIAEDLKKAGKQLEEAGKQLEETKPDINAVLQDFTQAQKAYQLAQKSGYVRATAREIMREDILSKKLKLPKEVENEILNGLGNPIDAFRKAYGEDALEQLDSLGPVLGQFKTEMDAAKIARKKFNFQPKKIEAPETTTIEEAKKAEQEYGLNPKTAEVVDMPEKSLMDKIKDIFTRKKTEPAEVKNIKLEIDKRKNIDDLIDEYNANQDRMSLTDEEGGTLISYDEFNKLNRRNKEIADALENKGISSKIEEEVKPEGIVIPFKKKITEPEEKAEGGIIRAGFASGGRGKKILDLINEVNKKLKGKKSMETVNPKTGEVTVPDEFVVTAEKPRTLGGLPIEEKSANISDEIDKLRASGINSLENEKKLNKLSLEFIDSLDPKRANKSLDFRRKSLDTENKLIIKAEEEGLDFDTYEKLRQGLYGNGKQKTLDFIKTGKVDLEPIKSPTTFQEVSSRYKDAAKAADEIFPDYNQPKTGASTLAEVMAEQKYKKTFDQLSGDQQQELYEEAYNYITSINKLPKVKPSYKPGDPITDENFASTPFAPSQETLDNLKIAREQSKKMSEQELQNEMNRVLNQYDKSMFIKNEQGVVDVTNEKNQRIMAELLRRDHPELYNQIYNLGEDLTQKQMLDEFDITGRKPNASGGLNYLMGF